MPLRDGIIDAQSMSRILANHETTDLVIEHVHAIYGTGLRSSFNFGAQFGAVRAVAELSGHRVHYMSPQAWQKIVHPSISDLSAKERSRVAALKIFREDNFLLTARSKVPHDGAIDAALIAYAFATSQKII